MNVIYSVTERGVKKLFTMPKDVCKFMSFIIKELEVIDEL